MNKVEAPSIGGVELNFDPKGNRIRQIASLSLDNPGWLVPLLNNAHMEAERCGATRRIVRGLTPISKLDEVAGVVRALGWSIEAACTLDDPLFNRYAFVYFSRNNRERISQPAVLTQEDILFNKVTAKQLKPPRDHFRQALEKGFTFERLHSSLADNDHRRLVEMYTLSFSSYPFDIVEAISDMVRNTQTHVYAARSASDRQLYAVSATEQAEVILDDGRVLKIREMGDSAKMPSVNGLNAPLKLMLIHAAAKARDTHLLFCETRAALGAVNAVNWSIRMQSGGFLHKHTVISGPADVPEVEMDGPVKGQYGNMRFWALNFGQIERIGSEVDPCLK